VWQVVYHPSAVAERKQLPRQERVAIENAVEKLKAIGPRLPFPHQSNVEGAESLRELRPRAGRSPWRAFYRRIGDVFLIGAIGPEAETDKRGFNQAIAVAQERLDEVTSEEEQ
jgi:hypothetical protein